MDEAASGAAAGLAQVATGYPFDTLKVHYQANGTIRGLGLRDLFRGILSPMYGGVAVNITQFWSYHAMKRHGWDSFTSGAVAGGLISLYESPIELIKCRMQTGEGSYKDIIKEIAYENPEKSRFRNLYRGFWATTLRNVPAVGLYYVGYEHTKKLFSNNYMGAFVGGAVGGIVCWAPNYPIDNWKTQIQVDKSQKTLSLLEVAKRTGWRNSWRGFWPCIVRAGVVNPFVFLAYEITITKLKT
jgi:solute carrier family 25 carnitine/acylcarnitine transporter 20/29